MIRSSQKPGTVPPRMQSWMAVFNGEEATVLAAEKIWSIGYLFEGSVCQLHWPVARLKLEYRSGDDITLVNCEGESGVLSIPGRQAYTYWEEWRAIQALPWYRKPGNRAALKLSMVASVLLTGLLCAYLFLIPFLSEKMALRISPDTESSLGDQLFAAMEPGMQIDQAASGDIQAFMDQLNFRSPYQVSVSVVDDATVNAFALPGGHIVVNTGLLHAIESYPELAALLAHEFIHVRERHTLRQISRSMGRGIFVEWLLGDMGSLAKWLANRGDHLRTLQYSRQFETDSDLQGLQLLRDAGISQDGFIDLMKHLQEAAGDQAVPEFLSSHPDTKSRIEELRKNISVQMLQEDSILQTHFTQLKTMYP